MGSALRRLRTLGSLETLFREAAQALCENLGFDRAAVFSVRGRSLTLESVHGRDLDPRELDELTTLAADPPPLGPGLYESEVLRRQRAVLVEDALSDPRALGLLPGASAFVAAPVVCHQRPVALMHADLGAGGHVSPTYDRETVWAFAEGFGCALERCVLASRLREQSARVVALARSTEASVVALSRPEIELDAPEARQHGSAAPAAVRERARGRAHPPRAGGALDARGGRDERAHRGADDRLGGHGQDAREAHPAETWSAQPRASGVAVFPGERCPLRGREITPWLDAGQELADESGVVQAAVSLIAPEPPSEVVDEATVPLLSIVVPTKNERGNVAALVERLEAALPTVAMEIIFVDDSDDGTRELVDALADGRPSRARPGSRRRPSGGRRARRRGRRRACARRAARGSASWTPTSSTRPS